MSTAESANIRRIQSEPQLPSPQLPSPSDARVPERFRAPIVIESPTQSPAEPLVPSFTSELSIPHDTQTNATHDQTPLAESDNRSALTRLLAFFGIGRTTSHARKSLVSVIWNLAWGLTQVTVIAVVLILTGVFFKDSRNPQVSEWKACSRPLGVLSSMWIARAVLASSLAYWEFRRDRVLHPPEDTETANGSPTTSESTTSPAHRPASPGNPNNIAGDSRTLSNSILYSRLTLLSSLTTLSWYLTAHVLAYTSIETCRTTSPHLWWLVFGIMCILYLMILEAVILGFVVLIITPILFILWNIILICLGRHPMQNPGVITPDVGKLSEAAVDKIPLVIYIPTPPSADGSNGEKGSQTPHLYPPKPTDGKPIRTQSILDLLRNLSSFASAKKHAKEKLSDVEESTSTYPSWFDNWEKAEYPFVTLEGNRATCAICLMDFEEPKRKEIKKNKDEVNTGVPKSKVEDGPATPTPELPISQENRSGDLRLSDAGEGAQPLRLLECGHAFHKTCVDPWLTDVSGRCPICQRSVVEPRGGKPRRA